MANKAGWCMHDAGILQNEKLSPGAKKKFIDEVKNELVLGTAGVPAPPLPCGPKIDANPFAEQLDLANEEKFPEFHKNVLGMYEQIALKLDAQSSFSMLPICCPVSLGVALDADVPSLKFPDEFLIYGFALPLLAMKLGFDVPVDLALKFPQVLVPIPKIPPFDIPALEFDPLAFPELFKFNAALAGLPPALALVIPQLFAKMPQLAVGILSFDLKPFCDAVLAAKPFGDFDPNSAIVWVVAMKVLARKTAECVLIRVVGTTLGSSSGGIVGGLGAFLGYNPPPSPKTSGSGKPRDKIVKAAKAASDTSLGKDLEQISSRPPDKLRLTYTSFLLPTEVDDGKKGKAVAAVKKAKDIPVGPLFARACLFRGGTTDDFYVKDAPSNLSSKLSSLASNKKAKISITSNDFPKLKKGDIVICNNASIVLLEDYTEGISGKFSGVLAGLPDPKNDDRPTLIKRVVVGVSTSGSSAILTHDKISYVVSYAIDVEKMLKSE